MSELDTASVPIAPRRAGAGLRGLIQRIPGARTVLLYAGSLGPGLIAANAGNDAAGIVTYASAGSEFIYRTLFFMVLVTIALVIVQTMAVKLGAYTGKGLAALIRERFSLRLTALAVVCLLLANTGLVVAEFAGIGAAVELLGVNRFWVIPPAAIGIWALVVFGSYRYAERVFLILTLGFLAYPVAVVLAHPDWSQVASNLVIPHLSADSAFLLVGVALIGTTVSPYMQFYAAAGVVDRGVGPSGYRAARFDAISGAVFACLISMCIIIATGAAIGGSGPLQSASEAAEALRPVVGPGAEALFAFGLMGASALAAAVVPLSSSYAISEAVGVERSISRRFREAPLFLGLFTIQVILGATIALTPVNLIGLLIGTQVLQGLITPIILIYILILSSSRKLLGAAANSLTLRIVAGVFVAGISAMSLLLLGNTILGFFGLT
ncbi:MAG: Mn transporter [Microbacterium sp. 14-71-5]|uniref:NRAMP family divalent metal transporter n=1 Tax=Microbacterium sp. 13-71-7 TaxID=1970399 RepID=UPI000BDC83B7|nr:divalent metal cation transporter [Microbacterium sp. 13-71-7]OZB83763.1 MAG: Mn transporter [Microbacterium sp. 13-71-7]OZB88291.1 MAG: Mn transporter [Microbacterium sp. 14-71-5]